MIKKKILVVEDERLIALEIATRLQRLGFNVCYDAVDAEEAIMQVRNFEPDIIFMDIKISGNIDGIETAKKIQSFTKTPIVYITAYSDDETLNRAKETMPYGYLTKPIQERDLKIVLEMAFYRMQVEKEFETANQMLKYSELRNRTLLKALPDLVFHVTNDGTFLDYCSKDDELLLNPREFINKNIKSVLPEEIALKAKEAIRIAIMNNSIEVFEYELEFNSLIRNYEARVARLNNSEAIVIVRDTTEINAARYKLIKSEERHRLLMEKTGAIVYDVDLGTQTVYREGAIEDVLGYTKEEFYKISFSQYLDLIHKDDRPAIVNATDANIKHGGNYLLQYRLKHKSGNYLYIEDIGNVQHDKNNQPQRMLGSLKNITARKLAEIELIKERDLFSDGPVIVTVMEPLPGWPIKYVSANVTKILGYSRNELLSDDFKYAEIIHIVDFERITRLVQHHINNSSDIYELSYRIRKKDGSWMWIYDYRRLIKDDTGKLIEIRGYMFDQTQLKIAMEELETSEIKYRTVAKYTSNWEYWINLDGIYIYLSPSVEDITGYKPEDFHKNPNLIEEIIYPDDRSLWLTHKRDEVDINIDIEQYNLSFRIITKKGDVRWIQHICRKIFEEGQCIGVRASNRDITEEIEAKRKLIINTIEVEESERKRFSKELHDGLGPLLATIKLYFQWLAETDDEDKIKLLTEKGLLNIERAIQTTREVSHGLSPLYIMNEGFVKAMCNFVSDLNISQNVKFKFDSNIHLRLNGILEITLYRIATELVNNALKYSKAKHVDIVCNQVTDKNIITLSFMDDGVGFDFNNEIAKGKGLGLNNIMSRVESLRGKCRIDSKRKSGTYIYIEFPLNEFL